ncbi:hypothetical protein CDD82_3405 [Ophiocordyceps australis]|uniref:FAS1-like dehydratase domain-containing protein n=1 Tax=Ophiocordyceps australis TaxID=1399860 RepID=A0A2C5ZCR4_9HYPO|nr:hypothetical protein CDD82_3405 [Ophiocordyceps australis]
MAPPPFPLLLFNHDKGLSRCLGVFGAPARRYSHVALSTAVEAAARLVHELGGVVRTRRQVLDANQVHKLALTLNRRCIGNTPVGQDGPRAGTPIPLGWHLVYFTPNDYESQLGPDGADSVFSPAKPFTRRMWAGGSMTWPARDALRVGDEVEEHSRLVNAVAKPSKSAGAMVLVEVEKELRGPRATALVDRRSWVFFPEAHVHTARPLGPTTAMLGPTTIDDLPDSQGFAARQFCWSAVGLFRFSALTFNGHKIHYNQDWTRGVEDHGTLVVHGPLNLINILNYWHDIHGGQDAAQQHALTIGYRAVAPLYAGQRYTIQTRQAIETATASTWTIMACRDDGTVCMRAEISVPK